MASYNDFAMDTLENAGGPDDQSAGGFPSSPAALPTNDVESVTIRKAGNGFIVEVSREPKPSRPGQPPEPTKPEKPQLAKSPQELVGIVDSLFGIPSAGAAPKALSKPAPKASARKAPSEGLPEEEMPEEEELPESEESEDDGGES